MLTLPRCLMNKAVFAVLFLAGPVPLAHAAGGAASEGPARAARFLGRVRGADYHTVSTLQTSGVVNAFWQSEIQATSSGKVGAKNFIPGLYDSFYTGRAGKKQEVSLNYEGASAPRLYADPAYSTTGFEVKPDDIKNTLDPLSAVTLIFSGVGARDGNPCSVTAPVFDGRRRYDVELTKVHEVDIRLDSGLYQGKGVQCDARYRQIAGYRPRVLKDNEQFPVIHAWFVSLPSTVAGRDYAVPVRIWAETKYGVLAILANSVKVDGQTPKGFKP